MTMLPKLSVELSTEQQFIDTKYALEVEQMTEQQIKSELLAVMKVLMLKDNIIKQLVKERA